jgi:LuxR family transcriptional regulator, maltose regulon positive regulatory protein
LCWCACSWCGRRILRRCSCSIDWSWLPKRAGRIGATIEALALQALAHYGNGDQQAALTALEQALTRAAPQGYMRIFVDEGAPMAALLQAVWARNEQPGYVARLLAAFPKL